MLVNRNSWGMQFKELEGGAILEAVNACQQVELVNYDGDLWSLWIDGEWNSAYESLDAAIRHAESKVAFRMKLGELV